LINKVKLFFFFSAQRRPTEMDLARQRLANLMEATKANRDQQQTQQPNHEDVTENMTENIAENASETSSNVASTEKKGV
jgi:hypothetical protein